MPAEPKVKKAKTVEADAFGEAAGHDAEAHDGPHVTVLMSMRASLIGPIQQF